MRVIAVVKRGTRTPAGFTIRSSSCIVIATPPSMTLISLFAAATAKFEQLDRVGITIVGDQ